MLEFNRFRCITESCPEYGITKSVPKLQGKAATNLMFKSPPVVCTGCDREPLQLSEND